MKLKQTTITDFDTLFKQYHSYVFKIVINESNNKLTKEDQEEIVSDIFFQLWHHQKKIKDIKKIKSYVGMIAKNTTKNKLRTMKQQFALDENIFSLPSDNMKSHSINEQLKIIRQELNHMDKMDKEIFMLFYYDNKKIKEIAKITDIKTATIKTRLHRTRKKLKKLLERKGYKNGY